jgi:hypothetical protein
MVAAVTSLQHFNRVGDGADLGLSHQQPKVIRHDHISDHGKSNLHA